MLTYREILLSAWRIAVRHPRVWVFGLLLAFIGLGAEITSIVDAVFAQQDTTTLGALFAGFRDGGLFTRQALIGLLVVIKQQPLSLIAMLCKFLALSATMLGGLALIVISYIALLRGIVLIIRNEEVILARLMPTSWTEFWTTSSLVIFGGIWSYLGVQAIIWLATMPLHLSIWFFAPLFVALIIIVSGVLFVIKLALCALICSRLPVREALRQGWQLVQRFWLVSLEMALILAVITFLVNTISSRLLEFIFTKSAGLYGNLVGSSVAWLFLAAMIVIVAISILVLLVLTALLGVFYWSVWVIVFQLFTNKQLVLESRLHRWFHR